MKKYFFAATLTVLTSLSCNASVTINLLGGVLSNSTGSSTLSSTSGVLVLVASTGLGDTNFSTHIAGSSLTANTFLAGDDLVLATFSSFDGGFYSNASVLNYSSFSSQLTSSDQLALYWFPTLTAGATITNGTSFGAFTEGAWTMPSDGGTVTYSFTTQGAGGTLPDSTGFASLTAVPEPATTVALLGGAAGLFVMHRRRQRKATPTASAS